MLARLLSLLYPFLSSNRTVVDYAVVQTRVLSFTFVLAVPAAYLFVFVFGLGADGVWLGIGFGNAASALVSFLWVANNLKTLKYKYIRS